MRKITRAMILAAGFGTRLKPLTDSVPKALVKVNGIPMIETVIKRLADYGVRELVVNTHHLSEQLSEYLKNNSFGLKINISHEEALLGTGGGIKNAERFLKDAEAFIVHNVDVLSEINFQELADFHFANSALATLAVKKRGTSRPLITDQSYSLIGRKSHDKNYRYKAALGKENLVGFCGIHVISSSIFRELSEAGFFDIFSAYFRLTGLHKKILAFDTGNVMWEDIGTFDDKLHSV